MTKQSIDTPTFPVQKEPVGGWTLANAYERGWKDRGACIDAQSLAARTSSDLTVSLSSMKENNGRITWEVRLLKPNDAFWDGYSVYTDAIKGRAEYEADRVRHFLGQGPEPDILDYDTDATAVPAQTAPTCNTCHDEGLIAGSARPDCPPSAPRGQNERDLFEAWASTGPYKGVPLERASNGDYRHPGVQGDWNVWQARASLAHGAHAATGCGLRATDAEIHMLRRLIECAETLDKRPRPMCRDCADEDGTCPSSGLECDMQKLFTNAKTLHNNLAAHAISSEARTPAPQGIYVASRASVPARPQMWLALRAQGWPIVSSWIDESGEGETGDFTELWQRIHDEIAGSCGVILYAEESDFPLKGAFIECGMALGMGKPVAIVLKCPLMDRSMRPLGSWAKHPLVKICQSLEQARLYVESPGTLRASLNLFAQAAPMAWHPSGPFDANELERMAKAHPDKCFLKGSGVAKLISAIRALEQSSLTASRGDYQRAGWFIFEGVEWVATSSDDPRATILYRRAATASSSQPQQATVDPGRRLEGVHEVDRPSIEASDE